MQTRAPRLHRTMLIGDDAHLLAELSASMAQKRVYLPILDGPRVQRPDADQEITRRNNAAAIAKPDRILFAGLPETTCALFARYFRTGIRIDKPDDVVEEGRPASRRPVLRWGRQHPGLGLIHALRTGSRLEFDGAESPRAGVGLGSRHVVLCEEGDETAQVIAANYAFSIDAGFGVFPRFPEKEAERLLEDLYGLGLAGGVAASTFLPQFKDQLREHLGAMNLAANATITFVTAKLPWGVAFPEFASTHLFLYPDLGIALINAIAAEQRASPGIRTAVVVDPGSVKSTEIQATLMKLTENGVVSKALRGSAATVYDVANTIKLFPYDLLVISTHCGDASGWRWTYEFTDTEGLERRLVLDVAVSAEVRPGDDEVGVTEFHKFVSLDGVDWEDQEAEKQLYVGRAILDFLDLRKRDAIEPVSREPIPRVKWSMALRMRDGNYIPLPEAIASRNAPVVINNACASWHRLASNFMFGGARCYVGTLFSVLDLEAQRVLEELFGRNYDKELATGLWRAQKSAYGNDNRRPYVMVGCHFQRLLTHRRGGLRYVRDELSQALIDWTKQLARVDQSDSVRKSVSKLVEFLEAEIERVRSTPSAAPRRRQT